LRVCVRVGMARQRRRSAVAREARKEARRGVVRMRGRAVTNHGEAGTDWDGRTPEGCEVRC